MAHILKLLTAHWKSYRHFYNYECCKGMIPDSNQLAHLCRTAKTHKFKNLEGITAAKLKFQHITDHLFTMQLKVIYDYLRPLCKKECSIYVTQKFPNMLPSVLPS